MSERPKVQHSKCCVVSQPPWVQIPALPPPPPGPDGAGRLCHARVVCVRGRVLSCPSALLFEVPQWFPSNVARNSPATASNIESWSLELQRLWPISKNDRVKLRATFGGVVTAVAFGYLYRPRAPLSGPAPSRALPLCAPRGATEAEPRRVPPLLRVCSRGGRTTSAQASSRRMLSSSTSP